ncbi:hypothetical protein JB92DRAFT_2984193 [Gautieria morchelliformis]|nr:hypothetical protein JB92DRAFT_2984193 [Gautieria morchelliformis]
MSGDIASSDLEGGDGSWNAYELVDGIFSKTLNLLAARSILFASLPSRDNPGSLILFEDVGTTFRDFAMDPTQDLIVYMHSYLTHPGMCCLRMFSFCGMFVLF